MICEIADDLDEVRLFLSGFDLKLDEDVDYTVVIRQNKKIIATASKSDYVFKCFAVEKSFQGENLTALLLDNLFSKLFSENKTHAFLFTKTENKIIFENSGFSLIHSEKDVSLLEFGTHNINSYVNNLKIDKNSKKAAIVMNCNPTTLGHLYLIEKAAAENENLLIFLVEEDKSFFSFESRFELLKNATRHLKNLTIIPSSKYIISKSTFPTYFIKKETELLSAYTRLDINIFCKYFCEKLNIQSRYAGDEPLDELTNFYNKTMSEILPKYNIEFKLIKRLEKEGAIISASKVRKLLNEKKFNEIKKIVPENVYEYLCIHHMK